MNDFETILYEEQDGIATVTLNRPEVHNPFNIAMQLEMKEVWTSLRRNDDVRVVIVTGAGEKAFCSGLDREEGIQRGYLDKEELPLTIGWVSTPFMSNDIGAQSADPGVRGAGGPARRGGRRSTGSRPARLGRR